ncbi:methionine--tRNA ligase mes1 [Saitoella coloradoensis]
MAAVKVTIPSAPKESPLFTQAIKVCVAAEAYKSKNVSLAGGAAQKTVTLELVKEFKTLIEANAIVRYLFTHAFPESQISILEAALIEWEESFLTPAVQDKAADLNRICASVSSVIEKAGFTEAHPIPAEIIIFATLYNKLSTADLSKYSVLEKWFKDFAGKHYVKKGVELAAQHTSTGKVSAPQDTTPAGPAGPAVRKVKAGIEMQTLYDKEILPKKGEKNILITSALPYVNNVPHLGNIVGSVLSADVFARYNKARNFNTLFICGTDEYGTATETKALEDGVTPKELCDKYHAIHADVYKWFEIGFDHFGRTTTPKQTEIAQDIFMRLYEKGYLQEDTMTQLWCEKHQGFLADRYVEGTCPKCLYEDARGDQCDKCGQLLNASELIEPRCKLDGNKPVLRDSKHIFLALDKLQEKVEAWSKESAEKGKWSANGRAITESWLKEGLNARCITRDLKWGTPVPLEGFTDKVLYVWFDATIGYVSITANYTDKWQEWWQNPEDVKLYQFMGKDNVPFHTVVFPATLLGTGQNWTMLHHINTTDYLNYEGGKFSKSRNVGVFGNNAQQTGLSPSVWRYYLIMARPETSDTQFTWKEFVSRNNTELLANLGNFVNRVIKFVNAKYGGVIAEYSSDLPEDDESKIAQLKKDVNELLAQYNKDLEASRLRAGLQTVMAISARGNVFLQDNKLDNTLFAEHPARCANVLAAALNLIYLISALSYPYMPSTSSSIAEQLNAPLRAIPDVWGNDDLQSGHKLGKAKYLFGRVDEKMEEEWRAKFGGGSGTPVVDEKKEAKKAQKAAKKAKKAAEKAASPEGEKKEETETKA